MNLLGEILKIVTYTLFELKKQYAKMCISAIRSNSIISQITVWK